MRHLLAIHAHPGTEPHLKRHWPYFKRAEMDILGVGRTGGVIEWPEKVHEVLIGESDYVNAKTGNLSFRVVLTFKHFLENFDHDTCMCVEYDSVILAKPEPYPGGFASFLAGYCPPEWGVKAKRFLHCPWWMDRATAEKFVTAGERLLSSGEYENGSPDVFVGRVIDEARIGFNPLNAFSRNTLDMRLPRLLDECKDAIAAGVWYAHGFRDDQHLDYVLGKIPIGEVKNLL